MTTQFTTAKSTPNPTNDQGWVCISTLLVIFTSEPGSKISSSTVLMSLKTVSPTREVLKTENKAGGATDTPMVTCMKESGKTISRKARVRCGTPIKTSTKDNGSRAKRMDGASTFTTTGQSTKETSRTDASKGSVR